MLGVSLQHSGSMRRTSFMTTRPVSNLGPGTRTLCLLVVSLLAALPRISVGQDAAAAPERPSWTVALRGGVSQPINHHYSGFWPAVGLGLRRQLSHSSAITLEASYAGLGRLVTHNPSPTPEGAPAEATHRLHERLLGAGITAELALLRKGVRPTLLLGVAGARVTSSYRHILTDTTGRQISHEHYSLTASRALLMIGAGVVRTPVWGVSPAIEVRYHVIPLSEDEGLTTQEFMVFGLRFVL